MYLKKTEFVVKKVGDQETITVDKKAFERWLELCRSCEHDARALRKTRAANYYEGKGDAIADILKHFQDE